MKQYIGDSVYADYDGYQVCLTTENGFGPSNTIYMEPKVIESLLAYVEKTWKVKINITKQGDNDEGL